MARIPVDPETGLAAVRAWAAHDAGQDAAGGGAPAGGPPAARASGVAALDGADPAGATAGVPRATLRVAVRHTLELLVRRAPGHAVEIRVPPLAAVQAIPGPRHRRGTPSAVVEMSPQTWLSLATGRLTWAQAVADGLVRASGERSDLTAWLPVLPLR